MQRRRRGGRPARALSASASGRPIYNGCKTLRISSAFKCRYAPPFSDPANNSTHGTFAIRRKFTNVTRGNVTRLRFRIVATAARDSAGAPPEGTADLSPGRA
ncbi:MAG TPA: hypothetical protein VK421_00070 [Pyrinomonadaceae bacterium]|nr:hypothetical protein [Pyrinomonadaceae bacterium]